MKLLINEPQLATRNTQFRQPVFFFQATFYQPRGSLQNASTPESQMFLCRAHPAAKPNMAGRSLTRSSHPPARAPVPRTDLLVQGRGVGSHSEIGLGVVLLNVLQAVPIVVHDETSGVIEENPNTVVTQLIT